MSGNAQEYEPELGQAIFGQPPQQFAASNLLEAALMRIAREVERIIGNRTQNWRNGSPFDNSGATFETDGISIHAYSWDESEEQPWNLKCGEVEVSWYKHSWRGVSVNRPITPDEISEFLDRALSLIEPCDTGHGHEKHETWKPFTYCGVRHDEKSYEERERRAKEPTHV